MTDVVATIVAPTGTNITGTPTLTGGSEPSGAAAPTISTSGNTVTVSAAGPIPGGDTYQLPTINLPLTVTAAAGSTIVDDFPTEQFTVLVDGVISATSTCTPGATPAGYDSTTVSAPVTTTSTTTTTTTTSTTIASTTSTTKGTTTPTPVGAIGGIIVAAIIGAGFFVMDRVRRRRMLHS
jgi:hypothetical protein